MSAQALTQTHVDAVRSAVEAHLQSGIADRKAVEALLDDITTHTGADAGSAVEAVKDAYQEWEEALEAYQWAKDTYGNADADSEEEAEAEADYNDRHEYCQSCATDLRFAVTNLLH